MLFATSGGRLDNRARYLVEAGQQSWTVTVTQRNGKATVDVPRISVPNFGTAHLWARFDSDRAGSPRFEIGCYGIVGKRLDCVRKGQTKPGQDQAAALQVLANLGRYVKIAASPDLRILKTNGLASRAGAQRCARSAAAQRPRLLLCVQRAAVVTEARTKSTHVKLRALEMNPPATAIEVPHA
jgi:hypothetical protein